MSRRAAAAAGLAVLAALMLLAGPVQAERAQVGDVIVLLNSGITPRKLPRDHLAPVGLSLEAAIRPAAETPLPRVKKIRLELAWRGTLFTRGLPVCPRQQLLSVDSHHAMRACGGALVGSGSMYSRIFLPGQNPFGLQARLLAFNGKTAHGHTAIWVLAYAAEPPVSIVLPFHVRHQRGRFPTVLVSAVPRSVGPWPRFAHFSIKVGRTFTYRSRRHSYLSASCPLPPRFTSGLLSLARVTFSIANGPDLNVESVRTCRADDGRSTSTSG